MRVITVPGVFRPRTDSVLLAGRAAAVSAPGVRVLDLFTGSGIVAVAAARSGATVTAVDVSRRAVACTRLNARRHGVRVRAQRGDMLAPVRGERFDVITANPPYVPSVSNARPRGAKRAWEGGPDGRRFIDRLCREAPAHLAVGGVLLVVHSSICDPWATVDLLREAGLDAGVDERRSGPLGPLVGERAAELEERGLLAAGQREEEVVIVRAVREPARVRVAVAGRGWA
jgi:release factor glutamine methyltransferase